MHYYKTKLRLGGSTANEVWKVVSAPELLILQFVHGADAVTNVEEVKNNKIDLYEEKNRLKDLYNKSLVKREQTVDSIFGALGTLPERLPDEQLRKFNIFSEPLAVFDPRKSIAAGKQLKDQEEKNNLNRFTPTEEVNLADLME